MTKHGPSQALLLLEHQVTADLSDVVASVEVVRGQGHHIDVDQIWLDQQYAELPSLMPIGSEHIPIQQLTPEVIEQLSKIELNRYDSVASEQLSLREFIFRVAVLTLREKKAPEDQVYRTMEDRLRTMGGIAVVTGTEFAIHTLASHYEALRRKRLPPQGRARFPYH